MKNDRLISWLQAASDIHYVGEANARELVATNDEGEYFSFGPTAEKSVRAEYKIDQEEGSVVCTIHEASTSKLVLKIKALKLELQFRFRTIEVSDEEESITMTKTL